MKDRRRSSDAWMWKCAKLGVILCVMTVFAYFNASNFDQTELKMLAEVTVTLGVLFKALDL